MIGRNTIRATLVYEYPCADGDPYYPIPRPENVELYKKYKTLAETMANVHFVGRLATYKYYNMDQVTAQALTLYAKMTGMARAGSTKVQAPTQVYFLNGTPPVPSIRPASEAF